MKSHLSAVRQTLTSLLSSTRLLALVLGALWLFAMAPTGTTEPALVRLSVALTTIDAAEDLPVSGWLVVEPEQGAAERLQLHGTQPLVLRIPDRSTTRLSIESPSFWAREQVILPHGGDEEVSLTLRPVGWLAGTLEVPADRDRPESLEARFEAPPKPAPSFPPAVVSCPVGPKGAWRCSLPGGVFDVRLRVPGYVSVYKWGVRLGVQSTAEIDRLVLKPGASVVGWVVTEDASSLGWAARASLVPDTTAPAAGGAVDLPRRSEHVPVLPRGFFHLRGIAPGRYVLRVEREGFAPAEARVTVLEGKETRLVQPLMLRRPGVLTVFVDPPRDPGDQPWTVELAEVDGEKEPRPGKATGEGAYEWPGLGSGEYVLLIESGPGSDPQRWKTEQIHFEPGMPPVSLEIGWLEVYGRVRLGDDPLEAILLFGGSHGERRLKIETDEDGLYNGHLPEPGTWPLSVYSKLTGWRSVKPVEVRPLPGSRRVELDVVLPETRLEGEVVDTEARSVEGASVTAFHLVRQQEEDRAESDEEGHFELTGLSPGPVQIWAAGASPEELSRVVVVHVEKDRRPEPIRLVLEHLTRVRGQVVAAGQPVAGAEIFPWVQAAGEGFAFQRPRILTDVDGRFEFLIPPDTVDLDLLALPPGFAARFQTVELPLHGPVTLTVNEVGGTLVLDLASFGAPEKSALRPAATVAWEDTRAALPYLTRWAQFHHTRADSELVILPSMSPGRYTLCVPRATAAELIAGEAKGEDCASGFLPPYGELRLGKPASEPTR